MIKKTIIGVIALIVIAVIGLKVWQDGHQVAGASPAGSTFNTAKFAGVTASFLTSTSTSVLNTDANDRYIIALKYGCTGVGSSYTQVTGVPLTSAGLTLKAATTSTAAPFAPLSVSNSNLAISTTVATSSAQAGVLTFASSTQALTNYLSYNQIWLAGSYLTLFTNATNTAACTIGVEYLPS